MSVITKLALAEASARGFTATKEREPAHPSSEIKGIHGVGDRAEPYNRSGNQVRRNRPSGCSATGSGTGPAVVHRPGGSVEGLDTEPESGRLGVRLRAGRYEARSHSRAAPPPGYPGRQRPGQMAALERAGGGGPPPASGGPPAARRWSSAFEPGERFPPASSSMGRGNRVSHRAPPGRASWRHFGGR